MNYWESILEEVLHKGDETFQFKFTDLGRSILRDRKRNLRMAGRVNQKPANPMYFLGASFPNIYFTKREAETLYYLLQGQSIPEVGRSLSLSARTIEFYVKNMKLKIGVRSKQELVEKLQHSDIINELDFIEENVDD